MCNTIVKNIYCKTHDGAIGSQYNRTKRLLIYEDDSISYWRAFTVKTNLVYKSS